MIGWIMTKQDRVVKMLKADKNFIAVKKLDSGVSCVDMMSKQAMIIPEYMEEVAASEYIARRRKNSKATMSDAKFNELVGYLGITGRIK